MRLLYNLFPVSYIENRIPKNSHLVTLIIYDQIARQYNAWGVTITIMAISV